MKLFKNTLFIIFFLLIPCFVFCSSQTGIMKGDRVRIRTKPDLENSQVIGHLINGEEVFILDKTKKKFSVGNLTDYWYKIKIKNGKIGWVFGTFIEIIDKFDKNDYIVLDDIALLQNNPIDSVQKTEKAFSTQPGYVYGNIIQLKLLKKDSNCFQSINSIGISEGYISADSVKLDYKFKPFKKRCLVNVNNLEIYLLPDKKSRVVLNLIKGEIIDSCGKIEINGKLWYRFIFKSAHSVYDYSEQYYSYDYLGNKGKDYNRIGWCEAKHITIIDKNIDQTKVALNEVPGKARYHSRAFNDTEKKFLSNNGFFIEKTIPRTKRFTIKIDDMIDLYRNKSGKEIALFLTSDLFIHSYHLIFSRMLQDIEQKKILSKLKLLTIKLYNISERQYKSISSSLAASQKLNIDADSLKEALKRNMWFFGVGSELLGSNITLDPVIESDVQEEISKILRTSTALPTYDNKNPLHKYLPGYREDYTQYIPRGHYSLNDDLKSYFRIMQHYGRKSFMLNDNSSTLSAILLTHSLKANNLLGAWKELHELFDYLIGKSDDLTPIQYLEIINLVFGNINAIHKYDNEDKIKEFRERVIQKFPKQRIVSQQTGLGFTQEQRLEQTTGFKFMGQRYTVDAEIFSNLTSPSVGTDANPKNLPSALEIMAILGSKKSFDLIPSFWWENIKNYKKAFEKSKELLSSYAVEDWKKNVYTKWLFTLKALFLPIESKQLFMNSALWTYKSLNTCLASWTELKHDTLLYSEMSAAEQGGPDYALPAAKYLPPTPKGYIEPNPKFFQRLSELINLTMHTLEKHKCLTDEYKDKFLTMNFLTEKAKDIALKEIQNKEISSEDYTQINNIVYKLNEPLILPRDRAGFDYHVGDDSFKKMALITGVATDAVEGRVLLEATGYPQKTYILVKDYWGGIRITQAYTYSHYEFIDDSRWTDEKWKEKIYSGDTAIDKLEHSWYKKLRIE